MLLEWYYRKIMIVLVKEQIRLYVRKYSLSHQRMGNKLSTDYVGFRASRLKKPGE